MIVAVEPSFMAYAEAAVTRLRYLYPHARFAVIPKGVEVGDHNAGEAETLARDIQYALYREKIYAETLPLRRSLIDAVTRR